MKNKTVYSLIICFMLAILLVNTAVICNFASIEQPKVIQSVLNYERNKNSSQIQWAANANNDKAVNRVEIGSGTCSVVIEATTKRVLSANNKDAYKYPASLTKTLTALVVLRILPLDKTVEVPKEAAGVEGSSIYLKAGQKITVGDLLLGLMLRSGNDAAVTLAIAAAGSVKAFAALMNETALSIGARNSHFVNPHGLHSPDHYSTAYDLALITAEAYKNDDFRRIVSTKTAKITVDGEAQYIANKNKLLSMYDGANGVKTGFTKKSGRCLIGGAERGQMQLISVVLDCPDMWNETVRLLDAGFSGYKMVPIEEGVRRGLMPGYDRPFALGNDKRYSDPNFKLPLKDDEYISSDASKSAA